MKPGRKKKIKAGKIIAGIVIVLIGLITIISLSGLKYGFPSK